ncbi:Gfo/Idh/MocA family protein [Microlunatus ginsengisoli]|uniref:Gfo/Idh/MocA family oxidoreductase n=1 Tax=Microlunatus ginsengisoli TaxID=363863 RepID=A0ABP6ZCD0_9ACTN
MSFSIAMIGAGQFAGSFAHLFDLHPGVSKVYATDVLPERATELVSRYGLAGTFGSFDDVLASREVDAVAIFTQRWSHGPLVVRALKSGKHVYSAVPMAVSAEEIGAIIDAVRETGLTYMMGETSHYNPAVVYAREMIAKQEFGRIFYAEGDYLHDMDLGFYDAYKYSGGDNWKATASYPPMLYPTHSIGGILGAWPTHATSVSAVGVVDDRGDGVFDRDISMFGNDFSNMTGLFEVAGGGSFRVNEFRRVGFPSHIRESRFRWFGTDASFEEMTTSAYRQDKIGVTDVSQDIEPRRASEDELAGLENVSPTLRDAFLSGLAPVHDSSRLPSEFTGAPNGHEGSHHFLADDFVAAVTNGALPPVNAWQAARYTLPGVYALDSARRDGERIKIDDFGNPPH